MNDASLEIAARAIVSGAMANSGQSCISTERVIVQKEVSQKLIDQIKAIASELRAGEGAKMSGLFTEASAENVISMVKEAVDAGAKLLVGDLKRAGTYVQPHVVLGAKSGDRLWERESFGPGMYCSFASCAQLVYECSFFPVVTIAIADTVDDAVNLANDTPYSLAASVWTNDMRQAIDVSRRIRSGMFSTLLSGIQLIPLPEGRVLVNQSTVGNENGFAAGALG